MTPDHKDRNIKNLNIDYNTLKILDTLNIGFMHMDMDSGIIEVNEKLLEWYGSNRRRYRHGHRQVMMPDNSIVLIHTRCAGFMQSVSSIN